LVLALGGGLGGLDTLADAAEAMLLADDDAARGAAAMAFGTALFTLSGGGAGTRWGLLWGAGVQVEEEDAHYLFAAARAAPVPSRAAFAGRRALLMLDRWAAAIAAAGGERRWRSEGLLLFRVGLIGR
jgi:phytoene synthase